MSEDDDWLADTYRDAQTIARAGAASDGAEAENELSKLPRLLRYAHLGLHDDPRDRLLAELNEVAPDLAEAAMVWCERPQGEDWQPLVSRLDIAAVDRNLPACRAFADVVRLLSMKVDDLEHCQADALRVIAALRAALREADQGSEASLRLLAPVEVMIVGWSILSGGDRERYSNRHTQIHREASAVGDRAMARVRRFEREQIEARLQAKKQDAKAKDSGATAQDVRIDVPADHVLVCPPIDSKFGSKIKEILRGHELVIGKPLPLVAMPDIVGIRRTLLFEFPFAEGALDTLLAPMVGRKTIGFPPVLIVGSPGAGKSRLARRLAECLGVCLWRTDGSRADGSTFGGTDKRWYSAEPCHPMLAVSRAKVANPVVLVDEIDKAATRADYGRLWDAMLGFLERETSIAYPDPCFQVDLDLSHVSYVATANSLLPLPSPLLDRFRVIEMPEPRASDLFRLVPPLVCDILAEQQLDERWSQPLAQQELDLLATKWKGGSVRRLRAYLSVLLRARERNKLAN